MSKMRYYRITRGTRYDQAVKKHFELNKHWKQVYGRLSEELGETITKLVQHPKRLTIDPTELTKEENKKAFKKDGSLKGNSKKAKEIAELYKSIIEEAGLTEYESLGTINFIYGVMRYQGETLKTFRTSEFDLYYKADFDIIERSKRTNGESLVEEITEVEYTEKYLEEIKKQEEAA
ncbi:hypothetical protein [Paenibacillus lautus]|uniref:hypothetical protein n=1 Tax=Paenibacillus lautus TaxID=1401 RepID=UPI001C7D6CCA|nr:hypothetical protein [Paenibacillus lautus]MBX4152419.1 hypothetical protein [Paenibacillus lautus]